MIRWDILSQALTYYQRAGATLLEVPWTVERKAFEITSPAGCAEYPIDDKVLVASAEQSFLQLALEGKLKRDVEYVALTPCFRGDKLDAIHHRYFMKVELMRYEPRDPEQAAALLLHTALAFFQQYIPCHVIKLPDGTVDIQTADGIELGSYGIRHHKWIGTWAYGTGVAEPRLSYAMGLDRRLFKAP